MYVFRYAGIGTVVLANNHLLDFGSSMINNTMSTLKSNNIKFAGVTYGKTKFSYQVVSFKLLGSSRFVKLFCLSNVEMFVKYVLYYELYVTARIL